MIYVHPLALSVINHLDSTWYNVSLMEVTAHVMQVMFGSIVMYVVWCCVIKKQRNVPLCGLDSCTRSLSVTVISLSLPKQILHPSEEEDEEGWDADTVSDRERNLYHAA